MFSRDTSCLAELLHHWVFFLVNRHLHFLVSTTFTVVLSARVHHHHQQPGQLLLTCLRQTFPSTEDWEETAQFRLNRSTICYQCPKTFEYTKVYSGQTGHNLSMLRTSNKDRKWSACLWLGQRGYRLLQSNGDERSPPSLWIHLTCWIPLRFFAIPSRPREKLGTQSCITFTYQQQMCNFDRARLTLPLLGQFRPSKTN